MFYEMEFTWALALFPPQLRTANFLRHCMVYFPPDTRVAPLDVKGFFLEVHLSYSVFFFIEASSLPLQADTQSGFARSNDKIVTTNLLQSGGSAEAKL